MTETTSRIKVLHIIDKFTVDGLNPTSCTRLFAAWVPHFDSKEFEMVFCGIKTPEPAGQWLRDFGNTVIYLNKGKFSPSTVSAIEQVIRSEGVSIVHLHGYSSANFGRLAAARCGIPAVVHEHAILTIRPHQYCADFLLRNKTTAGVAVSQAVKRFMIHGRSIPEQTIRVIHNGVIFDDFHASSPDQVAALRAELCIPDGFSVVGTVTRLREEKGNRYFIDAAARVVHRFPKTKFVLIGEGPLRGELESQAARLGIRDSVLFTGFRQDIPVCMSMFTVLVMPSLTEGFPLVLVEAMAVGKAVVATRVGGISEIVQDGVDALLVPPTDFNALAEKIELLLTEPQTARRIAQTAIESCRRFSLDSNVRQLQDLYRQLVKRP